MAYAAEIRQLDTQFARVIDTLKSLDQYDNTLIVFLSDHGEQFQEHGESAHAKSLFEEELRIPLHIKLPGNDFAGAERKEVVAMEGLPATLLELIDMDPPDTFEGKSFADALHREMFSEEVATATLRFDDRLLHMARNYDYKYIYDAVRGQDRWYDLLEDRDEIDPLSEPPEGAEHLRSIARYAAVRDAAGLHIQLNDSGTFEVTIDGEEMGTPTVTDGDVSKEEPHIR